MLKRFFSVFLITCILSLNTFSSLTAYAIDVSEIDMDSITFEDFCSSFAWSINFASHISDRYIGYVIKDLPKMMYNNKVWKGYIRDLFIKYHPIRDMKHIQVDLEDIKKMLEIENNALKEMDGYFLLTQTATIDDVAYSVNFSKQSQLDFFYEDVGKQFFAFYLHYGQYDYLVSYPFSSPVDCAYIDNERINKELRFHYSDTDKFSLRDSNYRYRIMDGSYSSSDFGYIHFGRGFLSVYSSDDTFQYVGPPLKIFYSYMDYVKYMNGNTGVFVNPNTNSNINNIINNGGTVIVNTEQLNGKDWSAVNNNMYNAIAEAIVNAGGWSNLEEEKRQEIITGKMDEILGSLGDIEDNTGESSSLLSTIKDILLNIEKKIDTSSGGSNFQFDELSNLLDSLWNESDKKLDNVVKLLEENNKYQEKIFDSLNSIKALLTEQTVMDFFKNRSTQTADTAKEKFPTSIPWDVSMVVNSMCAPPEAPVVTLPLEISSLRIKEEIVVDLSKDEWQKLAKMCRSLLSVLFILYLIHLTKDLFYKGGGE